VDDGGRYDEVRREFPELRYAPPAWFHPPKSDWARVIPLAEDVPSLANLTYHCDINVNTASTMTLDFAARDKPVVNIAFDVATPPPLGTPLYQVYYQYEHYRPVIELGAARIARNAADLADHLNAYLSDPSLDREGRRRLLELEIELPLGAATGRVLEVLQRVGAPAAAAPATRVSA
jgi:CDP-glycerol glycerophosphotransferase (TagB/SpsB family)